MNVNLPECSKVLVLAPHPDDEALGCSGTLILLNRRGVTSTIFFITNGEKLYQKPSSEIGEKRKQEGCTISQMLGCREPLFLNFPDGEIERYTDEIYDTLYGLIRATNPDIVFAPSPIDYHADHIATSRIALKLLRNINTIKVLFYEIYSTIRFNYLIDITEVAEQKKRIISAYHCSLYEKPDVYVHAILGLNAQRAIFTQQQAYYEAFYLAGANENSATISDFLAYKKNCEEK